VIGRGQSSVSNKSKSKNNNNNNNIDCIQNSSDIDDNNVDNNQNKHNNGNDENNEMNINKNVEIIVIGDESVESEVTETGDNNVEVVEKGDNNAEIIATDDNTDVERVGMSVNTVGEEIVGKFDVNEEMTPSCTVNQADTVNDDNNHLPVFNMPELHGLYKCI